MMNLYDYLLGVELPKKSIYIINDTDDMDIFDEILNSIKDEKKDFIRDTLQFNLKYSFISPIILGMIESDLTFLESFDKRSEYVMKKVDEFKYFLNIANGDVISKIVFHKNMCEFIDQSIELYNKLNNPNSKMDDKIYVDLQGISATFCYMVHKSGIELIINEVIENESIKDALENNIVNPLNEIILSRIKEMKNDINLDKNLVTQIREELNNLFINLPIRFVLSIILSECINEDIPPSEVACSIKFKDIFREILEKVTDYKEVSSIIEYWSYTIQII